MSCCDNPLPHLHRIVFDLPEPPNLANARLHWAMRYRKVDKYKRAAWEAAINQVKPPEHPPEKVMIRAHFRLWSKRDHDNLVASLKPALDALQQDPPGKCEWRIVDGMRASWMSRGFFVDDSPDHLEIEEVTQEVSRKNRGLTLTVEAV